MKIKLDGAVFLKFRRIKINAMVEIKEIALFGQMIYRIYQYS